MCGRLLLEEATENRVFRECKGRTWRLKMFYWVVDSRYWTSRQCPAGLHDCRLSALILSFTSPKTRHPHWAPPPPPTAFIHPHKINNNLGMASLRSEGVRHTSGVMLHCSFSMSFPRGAELSWWMERGCEGGGGSGEELKGISCPLKTHVSFKPPIRCQHALPDLHPWDPCAVKGSEHRLRS